MDTDLYDLLFGEFFYFLGPGAVPESPAVTRPGVHSWWHTDRDNAAADDDGTVEGFS